MFIEHLIKNHLEVKKTFVNDKQKELNIPECLFKEPIENKFKKIYIILNY